MKLSIMHSQHAQALAQQRDESSSIFTDSSIKYSIVCDTQGSVLQVHDAYVEAFTVQLRLAC